MYKGFNINGKSFLGTGLLRHIAVLDHVGQCASFRCLKDTEKRTSTVHKCLNGAQSIESAGFNAHEMVVSGYVVSTESTRRMAAQCKQIILPTRALVDSVQNEQFQRGGFSDVNVSLSSVVSIENTRRTQLQSNQFSADDSGGTHYSQDCHSVQYFTRREHTPSGSINVLDNSGHVSRVTDRLLVVCSNFTSTL